MSAVTVARARLLPTRRPSRTTLRSPSVLWCIALIVTLKTALRMWGFASVTRWLRRRVSTAAPLPSVDIESILATERSVAMAGALYPGRALCLEQSLVLYYLLRRQGIAVRYRQGVIASPFEAHAWIEYQGQVINDVPEHARRFAPFPDQLP